MVINTLQSHSFWINHTVRTISCWLYMFILIVFTIFHCFRMYHSDATDSNNSNKSSIFKLLSIKRISYIIIIVSILTILNQIIIYTPTQFNTNNEWMTDNICKISILLNTICISTAKLLLHLFVAVRAQIHRNEVKPIWLNIGLFMILSDLLLILSVIIRIAKIDATVTQNFLCSPNSPLWLYVWFAANDFIIGIYCLLAFILPLLNYIKLEEKVNMEISSNQRSSTNFSESIDLNIDMTFNTPTVRSITKKIIIYNSIALISTMIITVYCSIVNQASGVALTFDLILNCICVILQFGNIKLDLIPKWFRYISYLLQCGCMDNISCCVIGSAQKRLKLQKVLTNPRAEPPELSHQKDKEEEDDAVNIVELTPNTSPIITKLSGQTSVNDINTTNVNIVITKVDDHKIGVDTYIDTPIDSNLNINTTATPYSPYSSCSPYSSYSANNTTSPTDPYNVPEIKMINTKNIKTVPTTINEDINI